MTGKLKNSDHIKAFLEYLREIQTEYSIASEMENKAGMETQDILHRLELEDDGCYGTMRMVHMLKGVRRSRRRAKDTRIESEAVIQWIGENKKLINGLEQLLGEVRKVEKANANRHYTCRTDVLDRILDGLESGDKRDG